MYRLKTTLERAIRAQMDEFSSLAEQRNRMMQALAVLEMPESIGMVLYNLDDNSCNLVQTNIVIYFKYLMQMNFNELQKIWKNL